MYGEMIVRLKPLPQRPHTGARNRSAGMYYSLSHAVLVTIYEHGRRGEWRVDRVR